MPTENQKDIINQSSFVESLTKLSDLESPTPLNPDQLNIQDLRNNLILSGIKLNEIENSLELFASLSEKQFRNMETGRGPAMVAAFGGKEKLQQYFDWTNEESKDQKTLENGNEESKSRGLRQFAADTIALAVGIITKEEYCKKVNWRVGKKFQKNEALSQTFGLPTDPDGQQKLKQTSSLPKGSAIEAYQKILSLSK